MATPKDFFVDSKKRINKRIERAEIIASETRRKKMADGSLATVIRFPYFQMSIRTEIKI
jgi:hypothetical protein